MFLKIHVLFLIFFLNVYDLQILELVINRSLIRMIQQVIDEDGSVKDSAVCSLFLLSFYTHWQLYCMHFSFSNVIAFIFCCLISILFACVELCPEKIAWSSTDAWKKGKIWFLPEIELILGISSNFMLKFQVWYQFTIEKGF